MARLGLSWRALCAEPAPAVAQIARLLARADRAADEDGDGDEDEDA